MVWISTKLCEYASSTILCVCTLCTRRACVWLCWFIFYILCEVYLWNSSSGGFLDHIPTNFHLFFHTDLWDISFTVKSGLGTGCLHRQTRSLLVTSSCQWVTPVETMVHLTGLVLPMMLFRHVYISPACIWNYYWASIGANRISKSVPPVHVPDNSPSLSQGRNGMTQSCLYASIS